MLDTVDCDRHWRMAPGGRTWSVSMAGLPVAIENAPRYQVSGGRILTLFKDAPDDILAMAARMAPWVDLWVAPRIRRHDTGRREPMTVQGAFLADARVLMVSLENVYSPRMVGCHEIWHAVERMVLGRDELATLAAGFERAMTAGNLRPAVVEAHLRKPAEWTAKMFEVWARARMEGLAMTTQDSAQRPVTDLFEAVWRGAFAARPLRPAPSTLGLTPDAEARIRAALTCGAARPHSAVGAL